MLHTTHCCVYNKSVAFFIRCVYNIILFEDAALSKTWISRGLQIYGRLTVVFSKLYLVLSQHAMAS